MPELPEVETFRRRLRPLLLRGRIERVHFHPKTRLLRASRLSANQISRQVKGARVREMRRRGKYLILELDSARELVFHLGMTGKLIEVAPGQEEPHTHARFHFKKFDLLFIDPRAFGRIVLLPQGKVEALPGLAQMGPEPLGPKFTAAYLQKRLHGRRAPIKSLLLDQRILAGLGNIYSDESLFRAKIHPRRPAGHLTPNELLRLRRAIRAVLQEAIRACGTTIRDYEWAAGREGSFQNKLRVYARAGQPCRRCGDRIARERMAGRSTFFCPSCQNQRPA